MRTVISTLCLMLVLVPLLIESFSEELNELFPGCESGIFPPLTTVRFNTYPQLTSLRRYVSGHMVGFKPNTSLLMRANVVIGWFHYHLSKPISNLFGETDVVFDINRNRFVSLNEEELRRLGVDPRLNVETRMAFTRAADRAADAHNVIYLANQQANPHANQGAIQQTLQAAHYQAIYYAHTKATKQAYHELNLHGNAKARAKEIYQTYHEAYNRAIRGEHQ